MAFATERAHREVRSASHIYFLKKRLLSRNLARQSSFGDSYRPVPGRRCCAVEELYFLARFNYLIHETIGLCFGGRHVIVAVRIKAYLLLGFTGVLRNDTDKTLF